MASTTSLLRSAQATQRKIRNYETQVASFEWSISAKTQGDFQQYARFLNERAEKATDPSEALSYHNTIRTARRSHQSAEVQRTTMRVLTGDITNTEKYNTLLGMYYQTLDIGDYDQAQNLQNQLYTLSVTIQNEMEAAQRAAGTAALNGVKDIKQMVDLFTKGNQYIELPDGRVVKSVGRLNAELGQSGQSEIEYFAELHESVQEMMRYVEDAYMGAPTSEAQERLAKLYDDIQDGIKTAAGTLSAEDIELAYRSQLANNPLYSVSTYMDEKTGETRYRFEKNKIDDFVWIRNDDGSYQAMITREQTIPDSQRLSTRINDQGQVVTGSEGDDSWTIQNRLAAQGITVATTRDDGTVELVMPDGTRTSATILPSGKVRYFGTPNDYSGDFAGLYEIDVLTGQQRDVAPDEVSDFGDRFSAASEAGKNQIKNLLGITRAPSGQLAGDTPINLRLYPGGGSDGLGDITGLSTAVRGNNLQGSAGRTRLIDRAIQVRRVTLQAERDRERQIELQSQRAAADLIKPARMPNLNQTPVRQRASNGAPVDQLKVIRSAPPPQIKVAPSRTSNANVSVDRRPVKQPRVYVAPDPTRLLNRPTF